MRKLLVWVGSLACALLLTGCAGSSARAPVKESAYQASPARLGDRIDISLEELLTKPRAELATLAEEWVAKLQLQHQGRLEGKLPFTLLPQLRLPLAVPVWRSARFSAKVGFSLPPYLAEDTTDRDLGLHLARFGDTEAAHKMVEPTETGALSQIDALRCERNYPVEWTRLVGLMLHGAQVQLATGDLQGGTEIVQLHRQLRQLLDAKAAQGLLGATLLPCGRETLARAAVAWKAEKKTELVEQAEAALADWGETRPLTLGIQPGTTRADVNRLLRSPGSGPAFAALATARAFDLFRLPFPDEGAEAVLVFFDDAGRLSEIAITYRGGMREQFPEPGQLAYLLEEQARPGQEAAKATGLRRRTYELAALAPQAAWSCEVLTVPPGAGLGAAVRFRDSKESLGQFPLPRAFGEVHLDRSFEQNRLRFAPEQRKELLTVEQAKVPANLTNPLPALKVTQARLQQETGHDVAARLVVRYAPDEHGLPPVHQVALPLWATVGASRWEGVGDSSDGHLALIWQDARTRYTLQLPYASGRTPELEIRDVQGPERLAERVAQATALDRSDRVARIESGKALVRIPRHLEQIELGLRRPEVTALLPPGQVALKRDFPGGLMVTFNGAPAKTAHSVIRQLLIRFSEEDRVHELRARYVDGPVRTEAHWATEMLKARKKKCGAPAELPASWATLWADLPAQKPAPVLYQWQDDVSVLAYERDGGGVELRLRDVTGQGSAAGPLPPLECLSRGPENCLLGMTRNEILGKWGNGQPGTADDALVLAPPPSSPYDVVLVWFEKDVAQRLVARHKRQSQAGARNAGSSSLAPALTEAWGRDLRVLGWPRRQEVTAQEALQSLAWHDDRTRIRMFWEETESGVTRLFTEWKALSR